ncbi:unnamed protein product [marine sediment metagenome]|uniref:Uncharacterized protein n=1 Tax=marine sediment metagenome TaxID=412755 RepID=X1MBP8_9ZZZZ
MVVKCFFKRSMNCIVYVKRRDRGDSSIILEPDMSLPRPDWCVPCLAWQQLKELKEIGDKLKQTLLQK